MEARLFVIGVSMGLYMWLTKRFTEQKRLSTPVRAAAWHAVFCAAAALIVLVIASVTMDAGAPAAWTAKRITAWGVLVLAGGLWGFFRKFRKPTAESSVFLKEDLDWAETIFSALLLASVVMYLFVQAFKIPSGSMRTTFLEGDHLFVNKFVYGFRVPFTKPKYLAIDKINRGDVVVFKFPSSSPAEIHCGGVQYGRDFIKRVIALPGDTVQVKEGIVLLNGKPLSNEDYAQYTDAQRIPAPMVTETPEQYQKAWETRNLGRLYSEYLRDNFGPVKVPEKSYFVMGDNRDHSCDSRFWGSVPEENIKGKAWFIYWPPARIKGVN